MKKLGSSLLLFVAAGEVSQKKIVMEELDTKQKIIGFDGREVVLPHHKRRRHYWQSKYHAHPRFHYLVNEDKKLFKTNALDTMRRISDRVVIRSSHPVLSEIVKVAAEVADSEDEQLAEATLPTFWDSLMRLSETLSKDPEGKSASEKIQDMKADMCGGNPDLHADLCRDFMVEYCNKNPGMESCQLWKDAQDDGKKEKPTPSPPSPPPLPPKKKKVLGLKKPHQQANVAALPSQGLSGDLVKHIDGETQTDDWRREFGPGQKDTYDSVCAQHPDSEWCRLQGYVPFYHAGCLTSCWSYNITIVMFLMYLVF